MDKMTTQEELPGPGLGDSFYRTRDWIVAAAVYAVVTIVYCWFAIPPAKFTKIVQSHDAILIAGIQSHTSKALFGPLPFWGLGIFYPQKNTICLSEPMITAAVLFTPVDRLLGPVAASNAWVWFSWWSTAMAGWAFLRHRRLSWPAAYWGGFFIACCPDHVAHLVGHNHLLFQAGFAIVPLALERIFRPKSSHAWTAVFGITLLIQVMSGMYMTVFFGLWCLFVVPASIYYATNGDRKLIVQTVLRHGLHAMGWIILTAALFLPVAKGYSEFGRDFPQVTLEMLQKTRATWHGYLIPTTEDGRGMTVLGIAYEKMFGESSKGENEQFIGIAAIGLLLTACVFAALRLRRFRSIPRRDVVFFGAVLLAGIVALLFSLGPFVGNTPRRMPYAYCFALVSPIRFVRALPRYAFIVEWAIMIFGAFAFEEILRRLHNKKIRYGVAAVIILVSMVEFLPIRRGYTYLASLDDFGRYSAEQEYFPPYAVLPVKEPQTMMRFGFTHLPIADGYSGYAPHNRDQELYFFNSKFPSTEALLLLEQWQVEHLFVSAEENARAEATDVLVPVWSGESGVFYNLAGDLPSLHQYRLDRLHQDGGNQASPPLVFLDRMRIPGNMREAGVRIAGENIVVEFGKPLQSGGVPGPTIYIAMSPAYIRPQQFSGLRIRYKSENWFHQNEIGTLYWLTEEGRIEGRDSFEFTVYADGKVHETVLPLGDYVPWITSGKTNLLRLDMGNRRFNEVYIERLELIPFEQVKQ